MEPPSSDAISIVNKSDKRTPRAVLQRAITAVLDQHGRTGASVCVLLTDDEEMRELNRQYRKIDESTDVLSFPAGEFPGAPLGDIAISVPYAERQAQARGVSLEQEIGFLAIHGGLHLLGYDDETEVARAEMIGQMNEAAVAAGLRPDTEWASILHKEDA
jgi:probable rRNA maturation factor